MSSSPHRFLENSQEAYQSVAAHGFGRFLSSVYREKLGDEQMAQLPELLKSFSELRADRHMGDGGTYRFRAYSRFRLTPTPSHGMSLVPLEGNSIYQEIEDNALNGGVVRDYDPLSPEVASSSLLHSLVLADYQHVCHCDPEMRGICLAVGVHQVRIVACGESAGLPSPEGIHRDRERFTFQHFMARCRASGGEFRAYDENKQLSFAWLQEDCLDTVMFEGTTWHSATPITAAPGVEGYRDIFLIDFDAI